MIDLSLLQDFIPEAMEHLEEMENNLIQLESEPGNRQVLDNIFRSAHTIKGSSEYMGMKKIAGLAHKMESLLDGLRSAGLSADRSVIDVLIASRDRIVTIVGELEEKNAEISDISDLIAQMDQRLSMDGPDHVEASTGSKESDADDRPAACRSFPREIKELVSGLKSVLLEATSKGVTEGRRELVLEKMEQLRQSAAVRESETLGAALSDMEKSAISMIYPDDAGDILAALHDQCSHFNGEVKKKPESDLTDNPIYDEIAEAADALFGEEDEDVADPVDPVESAPSETEKATASSLEEAGDEVYEEEYDEELFGIFMEHLRENFEKLEHQVRLSRSAEDIGDVIGACLEIVGGLQSSASYMDYKGLNDLYAGLQSDLENALEAACKKESVSLEIVSPYLEKIAGRFPRYEKDLLGMLAGRSDPTDAPQIPPERSASDAPEESGSSRVPDADSEENQGLFDDLDNVFDSGEAAAGDIDDEPFDGDIEGLLASIGNTETVPDADDDHGEMTAQEFTEQPDEEPDQAAAPDAELPYEPEAAETAGEVENVPKEVPAGLSPVPHELLSEGQPKEAEGENEPVTAEAVQKDESGSVHYDYTGDKIVKQSLRVDTRKIDSLMNQVGELVVSRASYSQLSNEMRELEQLLKGIAGIDSKDLKRVRNLSFRIGEATVALGRVANDLQEGVMKVRMLPIAQLFNRYPRLVRDLVQGTDKKVHLEVRGEETELDKMVIEQIADPMIHIIRNAVDHGIETATERLEKGKPEEAKLTLESYHESNHVVVEVTDDGRGINPEKIKKVALQRKFVSMDELERLNDREITSLIMRPGFSTISEVTKTSGRGVGMDVVKKNIEKLNGTIEIDSSIDEGTRVRIKIPLTMAIIQALLVRVGKEIFTIPLSSVEETIRTHEDAISLIDGVEVIHLRNATLSLLRLTDIFGTRSTTQDRKRPYVVVVNTGMKRVGLVVDALIGQEETVIKPLADYLQENSGFSGATILGDGRISLILDVYELVNLTINKRNRNREYSESYLKSEGGMDEGPEVPATLH